jgi:hypothetical protein
MPDSPEFAGRPQDCCHHIVEALDMPEDIAIVENIGNCVDYKVVRKC